MPNEKRKELSQYRIECAKDSIGAAQELFESGFYKDSINRSYYGIFHSLRSVLALDGVDFKKHSAVISYFQKEYVKTGIFDISVSRNITGAFEIRNESDYKDFFIASKSDAEMQVEHAKEIATSVAAYISAQTNTANEVESVTPEE